jgi:hypothetical protein
MSARWDRRYCREWRVELWVRSLGIVLRPQAAARRNADDPVGGVSRRACRRPWIQPLPRALRRMEKAPRADDAADAYGGRQAVCRLGWRHGAHHPGETLRKSETVDATINHFPKPAWGAASEVLATDHIARQVFDLPEPQPLIVTEHRAHSCCCAACGAQTRADFPEGVTFFSCLRRAGCPPAPSRRWPGSMRQRFALTRADRGALRSDAGVASCGTFEPLDAGNVPPLDTRRRSERHGLDSRLDAVIPIDARAPAPGNPSRSRSPGPTPENPTVETDSVAEEADRYNRSQGQIPW